VIDYRRVLGQVGFLSAENVKERREDGKSRLESSAPVLPQFVYRSKPAGYRGENRLVFWAQANE
jgi:hypothetical protein